MALGLALRVWGIGSGLPFIYHPDEPLGVQVALNIVKTGDLNPHFFGYGSLFFYLNALAQFGYYFFGHIAGLFHSPADIPNLQTVALGVGRTFLPSQFVLARLVSVLTGVLCIPAAYWLGIRLSTRRVGLGAALGVALAAPLVLHSQLVTPNILATLTVLLTLITLIRLTPDSAMCSHVLVGIAFGSGLACKYNAGMLIIPYLLTYVSLHGRRALHQRGLYVGLSVAALTFLAVTPYALLDLPKFIEDTQFHLTYYATASHPGMEGHTVEYYLAYLLRLLGPFIFLSVLPIIAYARRRNRAGLILASFAIPYVAYIATLHIRNGRTILIVLPILLMMAADGLERVWQHSSQLKRVNLKWPAQVGLIAFVAVTVAYLGWKTIDVNIQQTSLDAREYARQWIEANVSARARLAAESYSPFIDPGRYNVTYFPNLILNTPDWYLQQGYTLLILSSGAFDHFYESPDLYAGQISKYDLLVTRFAEIARFDQNGITIRVLSTGPTLSSQTDLAGDGVK